MESIYFVKKIFLKKSSNLFPIHFQISNPVPMLVEKSQGKLTPTFPIFSNWKNLQIERIPIITVYLSIVSSTTPSSSSHLHWFTPCSWQFFMKMSEIFARNWSFHRNENRTGNEKRSSRKMSWKLSRKNRIQYRLLIRAMDSLRSEFDGLIRHFFIFFFALIEKLLQSAHQMRPSQYNFL